MNFPLSIIPTYIVTSRFYGHLGLLVIIIIACMFKGFSYHSYYTIIDLCAFCIFINIICSTFNVYIRILVRDTQMIMQALMRILFYMSPILWVPKNHGVSGIIHKL